VIHKIRLASLRVSFFLLIMAALGSILVRVFLLSIDDYKTTIESKIFELTEIPIDIGVLQPNMRGFNPGIILKDIRIFPTEGNEQQAIKLEEIRFSINFIDLIWTRQLLPSSWLTLVGAKLSVVRKEDGSLSIKGLNSNAKEQPLWLLSGGRYEVLKSEITWLDQKRHAEPLKFDNIDLLLENDIYSDKHEIHLLSQLPESIGGDLRVSMSIHGDVFKKNNISGLIYVKGNNVQLAELLTGERPSGIEIVAGNGDFELWSQWKNSKNIGLTGNVHAKNIKLKKQKNTYELDSLISAFESVNLESSGWQFGVKDFKAKVADKEWPAASFVFSGNHELTKIAASIEQLDLQQFSELMHFFSPLDKDKQQLLSGLAVKGQIKEFSGYFNTEKNTFAVNGVFENIFTSAFENIPQIKNLSASIYGTNEQGTVGFNTGKSSLFSPDILRSAIAINKVSGQIAWQQQENSWFFESEQLVLNLKDAETKTAFKLTLPKNDDSGFLDLQSSFANLDDVSTIPDYYPVSMMTKSTLTWLDNAFVSGNIKTGGLLFSGKFDQYPFLQNEGVFEVLLDAANVELEFSPNWPHLHNVSAEIAFHHGGLTVTADHAEVNGLNITHALVEIPQFGKSKNVSVKGRAVGRIDRGLAFMQQTPLHHNVDKFLDVIKPSGNIDVYLDSQVPLLKGLQSKVNARVRLKDVGLNIKSIDLDVTEVNGDLIFTEKGLFAKQIKAKALGETINTNIDTQDFNTTVKATGRTNFKQLKQQFDFLNTGLLRAKQITGNFNYQLKLELPSVETKKSAKLNIETNLVGLKLDLPGLLKKKTGENKNLELELLLNEAELLPLKLNFNNDIKVAMYINKQQKKMHSANIIYGKGLATLPVGNEVTVYINQDEFNISKWLTFMGRDSSKKQTTPVVNKLNIKTANLQWNKQDFGNFEMVMTQDGQKWSGYLFNSVAEGDFYIPFNQTDKDKIKLEMAYINLSELIKIKQKKGESTMTDLPLIDISSKQLLWNDVNLGSLKIGMERLLDGLRFSPVNVIANGLELKMSADWIKQGQDSLTYFQGDFITEDIGKVMAKLGMRNDIKDAEAVFNYSGQWPKAPYNFSLSTMKADVEINLKNGRISSIEPGVGRALGLLAMEQWIKRLTLDFSDLYKKGLSFNSITGLVTINQGTAHTNRLFVDAIPARIILSGDTDLLTETLDLTIDVIPKSSGAVPIAGTIISGIAGTITQVVASDYKDGYFFGSKYQATGKWGDIQLTALHKESGLLNKTWTGFTNLFRTTPVIE